MITYRQTTGEFFRADGARIGVGYAGKGDGKNNPLMQGAHNVGPLPRARYRIESPIDTKKHGPYVLWLTHLSGDMLGRDGFGIHADSIAHPGNASEGCIVTSGGTRKAIWDGGDHELSVVT